jgi:hypothetical protein
VTRVLSLRTNERQLVVVVLSGLIEGGVDGEEEFSRWTPLTSCVGAVRTE